MKSNIIKIDYDTDFKKLMKPGKFYKMLYKTEKGYKTDYQFAGNDYGNIFMEDFGEFYIVKANKDGCYLLLDIQETARGIHYSEEYIGKLDTCFLFLGINAFGWLTFSQCNRMAPNFYFEEVDPTNEMAQI